MNRVSSPLRNSLDNEITVKVAQTQDEFLQALVIRAAVYVGEQKCKYAEEYDGNDMTCTHLVAYVDDEPAATLRIRYFGGFVKTERVAVRQEFRALGVAADLMKFTIAFCRRKGFARIYGHSQKRLVPYWSKFGFLPCGDQFNFSDHEYVPIVCELGETPDALSIETDDMVLIRPEGCWDVPGILDSSAERAPSNPGV